MDLDAIRKILKEIYLSARKKKIIQGIIIAGAAMAYLAILGSLALQYWGIPFAILSYLIMQ